MGVPINLKILKWCEAPNPNSRRRTTRQALYWEFGCSEMNWWKWNDVKRRETEENWPSFIFIWTTWMELGVLLLENEVPRWILKAWVWELYKLIYGIEMEQWFSDVIIMTTNVELYLKGRKVCTYKFLRQKFSRKLIFANFANLKKIHEIRENLLSGNL